MLPLPVAALQKTACACCFLLHALGRWEDLNESFPLSTSSQAPLPAPPFIHRSSVWPQAPFTPQGPQSAIPIYSPIPCDGHPMRGSVSRLLPSP
ncbi:hypothetical protein T484DRAFT_1956704 [Baffinella frigidus]|nr:hypothetical protein T484DRAFT_1956704 [Cryptophyta sp. CCMP2293]